MSKIKLNQNSSSSTLKRANVHVWVSGRSTISPENLWSGLHYPRIREYLSRAVWQHVPWTQSDASDKAEVTTRVCCITMCCHTSVLLAQHCSGCSGCTGATLPLQSSSASAATGTRFISTGRARDCF